MLRTNNFAAIHSWLAIIPVYFCIEIECFFQPTSLLAYFWTLFFSCKSIFFLLKISTLDTKNQISIHANQ